MVSINEVINHDMGILINVDLPHLITDLGVCTFCHYLFIVYVFYAAMLAAATLYNRGSYERNATLLMQPKENVEPVYT